MSPDRDSNPFGLCARAARALRAMERHPLTHGRRAYVGGISVPPMTFSLMQARGWIRIAGVNRMGETVFTRTESGRLHAEGSIA